MAKFMPTLDLLCNNSVDVEWSRILEIEVRRKSFLDKMNQTMVKYNEEGALQTIYIELQPC